MRPDHLIVIAGGKATRLGPITATMSKALVTVGSQPMLIRQILGVDAKRVTIVTAPANDSQVAELVARTFGGSIDGRFMVQQRARGPVDAVRLGLSAATPGERTVVIFADSLYDFAEVRRHLTEQVDDWVAVTEGDGLPRRSFCWTTGSGGPHWEDSDAWESPSYVFTGMIVTSTPDKWRHAANREMDGGWSADEIGMSGLLERMRPEVIEVPWHDTGDVPALAATTRALFIKRDHHKLVLDDRGVITKTGCTDEQMAGLVRFQGNPLFPRAFRLGENVAELEYVDLPSLAELWLYWPGTTDMWQHIIGRLLDVVDEHLWPSPQLITETARARSRKMLVNKLLARTADQEGIDPVAIKLLVERLEPVIDSPITGHIHGDLNMTNILYSARTDTFKLLDPRGDWGDDTGLGDVRYDLAKLRYSWHGFVTTVHGLNRYHGAVSPEALDDVIANKFPMISSSDLAAVEASIFLSALPLHPPEQRPHLLRHGYERLSEALE